jgi:hypothetical protein
MMGADQDNPKVFHKYDSDDRQILVDLLHEYSEKLVSMSRGIILNDDQGNRKSEFNSFAIFTLALSICISYLLWNFFQAFEEANNKLGNIIFLMLHWNFLSSQSFINILCTAAPLFAFMYWRLSIHMGYGLKARRNDYFDEMELNLQEKETQMIAGKLESVMRLTVEVTNQVETNLARKLELDLRLADASYALEFYYSIVGLKAKPQSKRKRASFISKLSAFFRIAFNQ